MFLVWTSTDAEEFAMRFTKDRNVLLADSAKVSGTKAAAPASRASQTRTMNRLKDEVYREMLLLEVNRPGAEMGLALALLRAVVQCGPFRDQEDVGEWLRTVCPLGLHMIEASLGRCSKCDLGPPPRNDQNV